MPAEACESCRKILAEHENNDRLADLLEAEHPGCVCEFCTLGVGSPGPVSNDELLLRIIISPRDIDLQTGTIFAKPFEKAFGNGVSVCRDIAANEHVMALVGEGLTHIGREPPYVLSICRANAGDIRSIGESSANRVFCIYDQTVTRADATLPAVPTHAGIFGRHPPPKTPDRKKIQKDLAGLLRELFIAGELPVADFRGGLPIPTG